ncbi:MAG: Uma2 family endonuclease [Chthonomonadales bacterium]|nr:Uma2 family endonuclease [Chthonomonadales bacterium]
MAVERAPILTPEEYLAREREARTKSEYLAGQVYAMAGASRLHNLVAVNVTTALALALRGRPCEVYAADMRVRVEATGLYTYPDIAVACDEPTFADASQDTLTNPVVIVEVLSDSTEGYDRGRKFLHYQMLESLAEYVLVSQAGARVEVFRRRGTTWLYERADGRDASVRLEALEVTLRLADVYERVETEPEDAQAR